VQNLADKYREEIPMSDSLWTYCAVKHRICQMCSEHVKTCLCDSDNLA
jgi:hypothetical protein